MEAPAVSAEATAKANELYWGTNRSVNQIAEDLDLSKGALYQIIEPLDAGLACPACGGGLVYANRTAKERSLVSCPTCAWDGAADEAAAHEDSGDGVTGPPARSSTERAPAPPHSSAGRETAVRAVAGGALLGAAAGLALVLWARRR